MRSLFLIVFIFMHPAALFTADEPALSASVQSFEVVLSKGGRVFLQFMEKETGPQPDPQSAQEALGKKIAELIAEKIAESDAVSLDQEGSILITGKAFPLNDELFVAAKIAHPASDQVFACKRSGPLKDGLAPVINLLSGDILKILEDRRKSFSPVK